ncbi:3-dehydroquinate synthase [candidate division KSB1 bacterium]|nr:3-dehydroquinate synthase [candidate division KSB1 bacterium]RQW03813.1 MAG: 3-dehydroquinate synthase [candidate division KSB1 bacterium]
MMVHVELGERSYPIYVDTNGLPRLNDYLGRHHLVDRLYIITDENVRSLYGETMLRSLRDAGRGADLLSVPAGEGSKSFEQLNWLYTQLLEKGADRGSIIIALGGGVVGDLAGFVAATFMRGIRFVQAPTTVLAQVDSSVGGKVGINHALGKNLIGAFHQPQFVLIDARTLATLPEREVRAGCVEILKYGYIADRDFFQQIAANLTALFALESTIIESALRTSCSIKADVVSRDERESGLRATLNFGHTIGHAIEAATNYKVYLHGEAVLYGMQAALYLSHRAGTLTKRLLDESVALFRQFKAPRLPDLDECALLAAMQKDKKRSARGQQWVLLHDIGRAYLTREVKEEWVREAIAFMKS